MKHIWRVLSTVAELDDRIKDELVQIRRRVDPDSWGITPVSSLLDKLEVHAPAELLEAATPRREELPERSASSRRGDDEQGGSGNTVAS